ncbi:hypothetical protein LEL_06757 [Akanthomyces lecanii RCEF 1005]|uniref:Nephrocystin 3-like N-terminal domain-containing protein n=1 Tax=Akanthomyces lecanii RCEF 1005 TaxID=1081108 RepID=A0A168GYA2_CORDF|nr:hypothetical protein LEL_06757 [Akanthomyces lecanii RCEF 1005]
MDPVSALGVAAAVVQFVDFGVRLISSTGQLYRSASGHTEEEVYLTTIASDLSQLARCVRTEAMSLSRTKTDDIGGPYSTLRTICEQCEEAAKQLDAAIHKVRKEDSVNPFTFGRTDGQISSSHRNEGNRGNLRRLVNTFPAAIGYVTSFDAKRWRASLLDLRSRMKSAMLGVLWERSAGNMEALERLSDKQTEMSATLGRIEKSSSVFRNSFVPFVSDSYAEGDPSRIGIVDYIWSSDAMLFESNVTRKVHSFPGSIGQATASDRRYLSRLSSQTPGYEPGVHEAAITSSLHFPGRNNREVSIPEAYTETFQWIYDGRREAEPGSEPRVGFVPWLEGDAKEPYWITGKPGAGKSTLMKFVTKDARTRQHLLKWSSQRPLILASFYFWNAAASQLQKSQTGLLRSLLVQCIEQMPTICRKVCPRRWAFLRLFGVGFLQDAPEWTWEELNECFQAMTALIGDQFNLSLFIDGLDEFDGQYQDLIKFVELFQSRSGVKILVSSRPENKFVDAFQENPGLKMEHFTATDVRRFAQGELNRTRGFWELVQANPIEAEGLVTGVVEKATGVFLWFDRPASSPRHLTNRPVGLVFQHLGQNQARS